MNTHLIDFGALDFETEYDTIWYGFFIITIIIYIQNLTRVPYDKFIGDYIVSEEAFIEEKNMVFGCNLFQLERCIIYVFYLDVIICKPLAIETRYVIIVKGHLVIVVTEHGTYLV